MQQLIAELNEILAHDVVDEVGLCKRKLKSQFHQLFDFLPKASRTTIVGKRST